MRIISGELKGSILYKTTGNNTRPLKDLVKESIFNLLIHSNKITFQFEKSKILDLYAGTGSFGLECISRKADVVNFVEKEKQALKILQKNIEKLEVKSKSKILSDDVFKLIEKKNVFDTKFDLIFCDPPFKSKDIEDLVKLILNKNILKKDGIIIIHRNKVTKEKLPNSLKIIEERINGLSKIILGKFLS